ncbi:hypothetical protein VMF7928_04286 [Vibrio marisflavi CECT 7928]|uniref:Salt-induced outer membrane protein n=1 Tax=Vibrio marisflavi CECT 7928 TaxID=634439 RepID=A0ABM9A9W6_9VIBR|nr:hypothetical protein VMF7928_04286 [Vibrio marisflavi CECT 7928]
MLHLINIRTDKSLAKYWLLSLGLLAVPTVHADELAPPDEKIEIPSPWKTGVEFGYQERSGNTNSKALNTKLSGEYTSGRWRSTASWSYYLNYDDGVEDKRQSTYAAQTDYKLGPKSYLYGSFNGVDSRYSAYYRDDTLSAGMGYQVYNTEDYVLELEAGPGYRYQKPNLDEIGSDDIIFPDTVEEPIFRTKVNTSWQVLKNLKLGATATVVTGSSNTSLDTSLSATQNITENIALKIAHTRNYHSRVPEGLAKADSVFSVNLVFSF